MELREWQVPPLPDCSVRPFAGANCPHRTPLNCVFWAVGNTAGKIGLVRITASFSNLVGILYENLELNMVLINVTRKQRTFLELYHHISAPSHMAFY